MIELEPGQLFGGRYKVIRQIGAGGMGAVYLAQDSRHEDFLVALKVLYPGIIKTREARERFRNEIVASYRVNHRNVVRAYEYFDQEDFQAYAMEYVDGGDLFQKMRAGPLPSMEVADILKQAASGLAAIHEVGIVHRDLKPENILLTSKGEVKITDFGVARLQGSNTLTQAGAMVGTPKYLAPEYVETGECDHRGDIYALGVIAYELVSGISPFRADSKVSLMVERLRFNVEPLRRVAPHCPPPLAHVIQRAMNVSVVRRYPKASDIVRDIELIEEGKEPEVVVQPNTFFSISQLFKGSREDSPAIYGLPGSAALMLKDLQRPWWKRFLYSKYTVASLLILVCFSLGILAKALLTDSGYSVGRLSRLPDGIYRGVVSGVMADASEYSFRIWRTKEGVFVMLGKSHCGVQPLSLENRFRCGDLEFELTVDSLEGEKAVGTMRELSWGTLGTWNILAREG
ncbi:MAG: serine/threonine protein kinase [Bdellovibrionales bacterium]|nr:serine/threonine protein kinase [Bdellovibrionales bacterium]